MNVLVIGAGNMGLAYAKALIKSELLSQTNLMISDTNPEKTKELKKIQNNIQQQNGLKSNVKIRGSEPSS